MNLHELKELGFTDGEVKVYSAVLDLGTANLNGIHEKTGIERRNIYDILNKLIEKGFVSYITEKGKRCYQCTSPSNLLEKVKEKEAKLKELEMKIPEIKEMFAVSKPEVRAEVYRGVDSIKALLNEVLEKKESFWMGGNSFENYSAVQKGLQLWFSAWMEKRAEKKHLMHDLVSFGSHLEGLELDRAGMHKKYFYEYKQLPKGMYTPMVLILFGNKVAQVVWGEQPFAFVLESGKVKESYKKYFDYFWK